MVALREKAEMAAKQLRENTVVRHGSICWPGDRHIADAIEKVAQEFANNAKAEEREACAEIALSDNGGGDIDFIAMLIRSRGYK